MKSIPSFALLLTVMSSALDAGPPRRLFDSSKVPAVDVGGCQIKQMVLKGGKQGGTELMIINNGRLEITVIPSRGMSILCVRRKDDADHWSEVLGWDSPVKEVVRPVYMNLDSRGGLGWLDGFNEWMVRCGLEFAGHPGKDEFIDNTGAKAEMTLTLHGKIGNIPAFSWGAKQVGDKVVVSGVVFEQMFFGPKFQLVAEVATEPNSDTFQIRDVITNEGSAPQEMMLLYHCNFGRPILEEGAQVVLAAESVRPMNDHAAKSLATFNTYAAPTAGFIEEVYLAKPKSDELHRTAVLLKNKAGDFGCTMRWSTEQLPYLTIWKNTVDERDGYVTGLEPGTCYPHNRHHERAQGRVMKLEPGKMYEFAIDVTIHGNAEGVRDSEQAIRNLQGAKGPQLIETPEPHETAVAQAPAEKAADAQAISLEGQYLEHIRQVTSRFPRAGEGYFSPDDKQIVYQAYPPGYPFYQIYTQDLSGGEPQLVSTGRGRTTCAYFSRDGKGLIFASSHTDPEIEQTERQARELAAAGGRRRYEWDFDPHMEIYSSNLDGTNLVDLTNSADYDAEGSYSHDGKFIVFTSSRDGDPDLYMMDANGENVRQITNVDGYDGGPFFSPDDKWIIFRSDRQQQHMLQLFAVSIDGKTEVQLTDDLNTVNWAPYFHPSGEYLVWTRADYSRGPMGANFDLFTMEIGHEDGQLSGGRITRITDDPKADVLPVFSNDGSKLMWTSSRTADGSSQLWIADWMGLKPQN